MRGYQWDWQFFLTDTGAGQTYLQWMLSAWGWTLSVAACAWVVALTFGALIGTLRTVPNRGAQFFGNAWVELFRNIPLLVQIFLWYHVIPAIFPVMKSLPPFLLVVLALGLFTSARVAEQVRAGIQSLPRGQMMAGSAMGLTLPQTYRYVILPMAFRIVLPPLTSEAMNIIKNSAVAFAVSIAELALFAQQVQEETSRGIETYLAVTTLYIISALVVNRILAYVERSVRVPGYVGGGK
ncbi:MAG TPA: amino acid ABC transporter permease [Burkholderiaceae bacterium]|jgi:glutamate/aspartate transport system permease protein|nr:amino acid ABC transporter permease [Burkholderiaceae bacterium]